MLLHEKLKMLSLQTMVILSVKQNDRYFNRLLGYCINLVKLEYFSVF